MVGQNQKSFAAADKNQKIYNKIILLIVATLLFSLFTTILLLADEVTFIANVDKSAITLNEELQLNLTIIGSQEAGSPELPDIDGFNIVSSGSSSQFSFINGKMSSSKTFSYILVPQKEGKLTIPPAKIEIRGKTFETEPIDVIVSKGTGHKQPSSPQQKQSYAPPYSEPATRIDLKDSLFITVTTDKDTAYIGEQITMTFKLYRRIVAIDNLQYTPPVTKGFVSETMGNQKEYREEMNGIIYDVVELRTAIFPATVGELTIEPAKIKCDLLVRQRRETGKRNVDDFFDNFFDDSFFSSYTRHPVELESKPITILVKPLPADNKPDTFKGGVGTFELTVEESPQSLKAGEPINLVMKISGTGNITQVNEPTINNLAGFRSYESEIKTNIITRGPKIAGEKIFRKVIIPLDENIKEIPPVEFSYFNPALNEYKTITKGPFSITVSPAPKKENEIVELMKQATPEKESNKSVQLLAKDIHFIETDPGQFTESKAFWYKNLWVWILIILMPIIIYISLFLFNIHLTKMQKDSVYAKAKVAHKLARQLLNDAIRYQKQNRSKEFYDSIARAIQKLISDRLNISAGMVISANLETLLNPKRINKDLITSIKNILNTCDLIRFGAHSANQAEMKSALKDINKIINILSKKL